MEIATPLSGAGNDRKRMASNDTRKPDESGNYKNLEKGGRFYNKLCRGLDLTKNLSVTY
jgi:hypothetical protein